MCCACLPARRWEMRSARRWSRCRRATCSRRLSRDPMGPSVVTALPAQSRRRHRRRCRRRSGTGGHGRDRPCSGYGCCTTTRPRLPRRWSGCSLRSRLHRRWQWRGASRSPGTTTSDSSTSASPRPCSAPGSPGSSGSRSTRVSTTAGATSSPSPRRGCSCAGTSGRYSVGPTRLSPTASTTSTCAAARASRGTGWWSSPPPWSPKVPQATWTPVTTLRGIASDEPAGGRARNAGTPSTCDWPGCPGPCSRSRSCGPWRRPRCGRRAGCWPSSPTGRSTRSWPPWWCWRAHTRGSGRAAGPRRRGGCRAE